MHWLKTKIKHILYHNFTDREFSRFMKVRALTCQLGEMPNEKQMLSVCPQKTLNSIREVLQNEGKTLREVLQNDIEDATEVQQKRNDWKIKKRQQREKSNVVQGDCPNLSNHREDKIREEYIREDKNNTLEAIASDIPLKWQPIFLIWLEYKKDRKQSYKSKNSVMAAYKHLVKLSGDNLDTANKIIEQSMANNWSGIFEIKNKNTPRKNQNVEVMKSWLEKEGEI